MNWETIAESKIVENLGLTLLHSVWQIALVALALFLFLRLTEKAAANLRYAAATAALFLSIAAPIATYFFHHTNQQNRVFSQADFDSASVKKLDEKTLRAEESAAVPTAASGTTNAENESDLISLENLRKLFRQNISAFFPLIVGFWLAGIMIFSLRLGGGVWQLHVYRTRAISAPDQEWQRKFADLCARLRINRAVTFLRSETIKSPVAAGFFKPVILIPASVFLQISPAELEIIITHELIHIRRADALVNFAQSLIEVLFFYHPCVWWMSAVVRQTREFATDEAVVATFGASRLVYAQVLANLETIRQTANHITPPSLATAANGGNLMQRISKILQKNTEITQSSSSAWSALLALAFISAIGLSVFSPAQTLFVNAQTAAKNKKLAIGFVSIPPIDRTANAPNDAEATMRLMIAKLNQYNVPAIGFVQGGMISDGEKFYPARANIARLWRDANLEIGVGGFRHIWFYDTPISEYIANTEKNERIVRDILAEKNLSPRYFSYPFLNTGKSADDRTKFENWLGERGLSAVEYTIDNQEWMYSFAYDAARSDNDAETMNRVRAEFLDYMAKMVEHYEAYSAEMFGRDINQTMGLTPSRLVADSADEFFGMLLGRGYEFVSMNEAQSDEAYQTPETFTGKAGVSWFERWQIAQNKKLRAEPKVSRFIEDTWEKGKSKNAPLPPKPPAPPPPPAPLAPPASPPPPPAVPLPPKKIS